MLHHIVVTLLPLSGWGVTTHDLFSFYDCISWLYNVDGPLMVNEIISWASNKKERLFVLKVDFEKAFDSLNWKFLDHTMEPMGFSLK